jgi:hypothetical protein
VLVTLQRAENTKFQPERDWRLQILQAPIKLSIPESLILRGFAGF